MYIRAGGDIVDGLSELAKMFKDRENKLYRGPIVGIVISPPPEIKIKIDDNIILEKRHLVIGASVLKDYKRRVILSGERIRFSQSNPPKYIGETSEVNDGGQGASNHSHIIKDINIDTISSPSPQILIEATREQDYIVTTDTFKVDDKVILIPAMDENTYFLIDWAVTL